MMEREDGMAGPRDKWDAIYRGKRTALPATDGWLDAHAAILEGSRDTPVIDLGCGLGNDTAWLVAHGIEAIACDCSAEAVMQVGSRFPGAGTRCLDMTAGLPFGDATAKVVIADLSIHYFDRETTEFVIREIGRVLRSGGKLLCRVNSTEDINFGAGAGTELERHYYESGGDRKRFFDEEDVATFFRDWNVLARAETRLTRLGREKRAWELVLEKRERA